MIVDRGLKNNWNGMEAAKRETKRIEGLLAKLEHRGLSAAAQRLRELLGRLDEALEGGSWLERNRVRLSAAISRHMRNTETEWAETAHLLRIARKLVVERGSVTKEERDLARRQLIDVLKTVPASAIVAGTFFIPIPGAQPVLAPILMERLGLLPSSWLESSIESELRDLIFIARKSSLDDLAEELGEALGEVRRYNAGLARLKSFIRENPDWRVFFDEDLDKRVSARELSELRARVRDLALQAKTEPDMRDWYVYYRNRHGSDSTRGPQTLAEILARFSGQRQVLVRRGDTSWWVPLWSLEEELAASY